MAPRTGLDSDPLINSQLLYQLSYQGTNLNYIQLFLNKKQCLSLKCLQILIQLAINPKQLKQFLTILERITQSGIARSYRFWKNYTVAKVIEETQRPAIIMAPNKTLAAQLYGEFKIFSLITELSISYLLRLLST